MMTEDKRQQSVDNERPPKEAYSSPELEVHGTVAQITQEVSGNQTDGFQGSRLPTDQ